MSRVVAFIDTHIHPFIIREREMLVNKNACTIDNIVGKAKINGVKKMICIGTNEYDSRENIDLSLKYDELYAAIGIHPCDILSHEYADQLKSFISFACSVKEKTRKCVAIGEIGIDLYHSKNNVEVQKSFFKAQIECALFLNLPIIIHSRNASDEVFSVIREYVGQGIKGVVHCFSDGPDYALQWVEYGFVLGVGGTVTYPNNNKVRDAIRAVGIKNIVLETDSPFLSPQSVRGKVNDSSHIPLIAEYLSNFFGIPLFELAETVLKTTENVFPQIISK